MYLLTFTTVAYSDTTATTDTALFLGEYTGFQQSGHSFMRAQMTIEKDASGQLISSVTIEDLNHSFSETTQYFTTYDESNANFSFYPLEKYEVEPALEGVSPTYFGLYHDETLYGLHNSKYAVDASKYSEENIFNLRKVNAPVIELNSDDFNWTDGIHSKLFNADKSGNTLDNLSMKFYGYEDGRSSLTISFDTAADNTPYTYAVTVPTTFNTHYALIPEKKDGMKPSTEAFTKYVASKLPVDFLGPYEYSTSEERYILNEQFSTSLLEQLELDTQLGMTTFNHQTFSGTFIPNEHTELAFYFGVSVDELLKQLTEQQLCIYIGGSPEDELLIDAFQTSEMWADYYSYLENGYLKDLPQSFDTAFEYFESVVGEEPRPTLEVDDYISNDKHYELTLSQTIDLRIIQVEAPDEEFILGFNKENEETFYMLSGSKQFYMAHNFGEKTVIINGDQETLTYSYTEQPTKDFKASEVHGNHFKLAKEILNNYESSFN